LGLADSKNADIVIISEPGKKATENKLKWGTHHISPKDASTHDKRRKLGAANLSHMNYLVYDAHGKEGDGEGGVVLLLHERWRHRVQHVERHSRGRWLKMSIQTPVGVITVIGYYGRPSPQSTPQATADWQAVQHMVHKQHAKGNIVVVAGDFNLSFNTPTHRQNVSKSTLQHTMLQSALATSGLTDTFIHRHSKSAKYFTWEQRKEGDHPAWTSPDHILISSLAANKVTAVQLDETTLARNMDHVMVTAAIHINSNTVIKRQHHPKLKVTTENQEQYNQLVNEHMLLNSDKSNTNTETTMHNLHEAMTTAALTIKPQHVHRSKGKIGTKLQADIRIMGTALRCINRDTQIPHHIINSDIYTNLPDTSAESVAAEIKHSNTD
jgi:exonuclease III